MAVSKITKQTLAMSLKSLMKEIPFDKICIAQICEKCGMNRKSFYYHFKDKYDLVNWIFDTEFMKLYAEYTTVNSYEDRWKWIEDSCTYFYKNRDFYQKALLIKGQNSFSEHFRELIQPIFKNRLSVMIDDEPDDFILDFFTDATIDAMIRWLSNKEGIPAEQFVNRLKYLFEKVGVFLYHESEQ